LKFSEANHFLLVKQIIQNEKIGFTQLPSSLYKKNFQDENIHDNQPEK